MPAPQRLIPRLPRLQSERDQVRSEDLRMVGDLLREGQIGDTERAEVLAIQGDLSRYETATASQRRRLRQLLDELPVNEDAA